MNSKLDNLNEKFLKCLERSFLKYLEKGAKGVRGTGKLKILYPHIAEDLRSILDDKFQVYSLDENLRVVRTIAVFSRSCWSRFGLHCGKLSPASGTPRIRPGRFHPTH